VLVASEFLVNNPDTGGFSRLCQLQRLTESGAPEQTLDPILEGNCGSVQRDGAGRLLVLSGSALYRYAKGSLDPSFGDGGVVQPLPGTYSSLALTTDDVVVLAGADWDATLKQGTLHLLEFGPNGQAIGAEGSTTFPSEGGVGSPVLAIDSLDRAVVAVTSSIPSDDPLYPSVTVLNLFRFTGRDAEGLTTVTEFYNTILGHYFITPDPEEAAFVDAGGAGRGWQRTGYGFKAWTSTGTDDKAYVCRFYGSLSPGPNSHFFTLSAKECNFLLYLQETKPATQPRWNLEDYSFVAVPTQSNGSCPTGSIPVYRAYNDGFGHGKDSNHRYVTDRSLLAPLFAAGWIDEGVAFCVPQ
jgi:hypothetical protein